MHQVHFRSLEEVGQILGCSRQAVFQAEQRAIKKIQMAFIPILWEHNPSLARQMELRLGLKKPRKTKEEKHARKALYDKLWKQRKRRKQFTIANAA